MICECIRNVPAYSSPEHSRRRVWGATDLFGHESLPITERGQSGPRFRLRETSLQRAAQSESEGVTILRTRAM